jgi:hypothetical protein
MKRALLALALTGCSSTWYVDARFTAPEEAALQAAADEWSAIRNERIDLAFGDVAGHGDPDRQIVRGQPWWRPGAMGCTHDARNPFAVDMKNWRIDLDADGLIATCDGDIDCLRVAALHELGHFFGNGPPADENQHIGVIGALMAPGASLHDGPRCVTLVDIRAYCGAPDRADWCWTPPGPDLDCMLNHMADRP